MDAPQLRFDVGVGPLCDGCPLRQPCGAAYLEEACRPSWGRPEYGGVNVLHPNNPETWDYFMDVGGPGFDDIVARDQPRIRLPPFTHRIRSRRALRGQLRDSLYLIGPEAVVRRRVLNRAQLATITGLSVGQRAGLILFGKDQLLEDLWYRRFQLIPEIAKSGYDFCVTPSYSNYTNRPRPEYLYNIKRSLEFFQLLQIHGVPAIPRLAWLIEHDVDRCAAWVVANPSVSLVALDYSDSTRGGWQRELSLLRRFDHLTGQRLRYLIHGPSVPRRYVDLYRLLKLDRVHLTNSRGMARPATRGMPYAQRLSRERRGIVAARQLLRAEAGRRAT
jgi:Domain of unknown function (DUF4417)